MVVRWLLASKSVSSKVLSVVGWGGVWCGVEGCMMWWVVWWRVLWCSGLRWGGVYGGSFPRRVWCGVLWSKALFNGVIQSNYFSKVLIFCNLKYCGWFDVIETLFLCLDGGTVL